MTISVTTIVSQLVPIGPIDPNIHKRLRYRVQHVTYGINISQENYTLSYLHNKAVKSTYLYNKFLVDIFLVDKYLYLFIVYNYTIYLVCVCIYA